MRFSPSHFLSMVPTHGVSSYCLLPHLLLHAARPHNNNNRHINHTTVLFLHT